MDATTEQDGSTVQTGLENMRPGDVLKDEYQETEWSLVKKLGGGIEGYIYLGKVVNTF